MSAAPKRRWRLWLRRIGLGLVGLVVTVVLALVVLVWVPFASQRAARFALERWDGSIPGEVEWQGMRGSLGAGLELEGLELRDGEGQVLVRADSIVVDLDMAQVLRAKVVLERVHARDLEVWVDHDWGALSGPPDPEEDDEDEDDADPGLGPSIPIRVGASVNIEGLALHQGEAVLVRGEGLAAELKGFERSARIELDLSGTEFPQQGQRVDALGLALAWDDPALTLERFELGTSLGRLRTLAPAHLDFETSTADLALELALPADLDALADQLGQAELRALASSVVRAQVEVRDDGEGPEAKLLVTALLGPDRGEAETSLVLAADASVVGSIGAGSTGAGTVELALEGQLAGARVHPDQPPLRLTLDAALTRTGEAKESGQGGLDAHVELRIDDPSAGPDAAALTLDASATATSLSPPRGAAKLELRGPGLELSARATGTEARALDARWSLDVDDLAQVLELAAPYVDEPRLADVRGSLALRGVCMSGPGPVLEPETVSCPISLVVDGLAGFDLRLAHASLTGELSPLTVPLEFAATLEVAGLAHPQAGLDEAVLEIAGTPETFSVAGHGRGERERFELDVELGLGGPTKRVDLDELVLVSFRGPAPSELVLVGPAQIVIGPDRVDVRHFNARAFGGRVAVDGHVGLGGHASDLQVQVQGLDLARVDPLVPGVRLVGHVNLDGALRGRGDQPAGWAWLAAEDLQIDEHHLGELRLGANLCGSLPGSSAGLGERPGPRVRDAPELGRCGPGSGGVLELWLREAGPIAKAVEVDLRVPLRFGARVGLSPRRELEGHVVVRALDLVELGGLMPATPEGWEQTPPGSNAPQGEPRLIPEGRVDLELTLGGSSSSPTLELLASVTELVIDRTALGAITLGATLGETGLALDLDADLSLAKVELDAEVPMDLDLARQTLDWDRDAAHVIELAVIDLDLDQLERTLGPKLPALADLLAAAGLGGRVSASVSAHGGVSDPGLGAKLEVAGLSHRGARVGEVEVELGVHGGVATGTVALAGPLAERLDAQIELPARVELGLAPGQEPAFDIDTSARLHAELHVHGVELAGLAGHLGPLPVAGLADLDVRVGGSLADPKLELEARLADVQLEADSAGDLSVYATVGHERAKVEVDLVRRGAQLVTARLEIPLIIELADLDRARVDLRRDGVYGLRAQARGIDHELLAALLGPPLADLDLDTDLRFDLAGRGTAAAFALAGELDGHIATDAANTFVIHSGLTLDEAHQQFSFAIDHPSSQSLTLDLGLDADVARLVSGELSVAEVPFALELDAPALGLELLAPFVGPALYDPRGTLHAQVSGAGVLGAPQLTGGLGIEHGAVTVLDLRQRLLDIELDVGLDGQTLDLRTLAVRAGRGQITSEGQATLDPSDGSVAAKFGIEIDNVPLVRPGLPAISVDSDATVDVTVGAAATRVQVALAKTEVKVAGVPGRAPTSIPSSDAIVFVSEAEAEAPTDGSEPEPAVAKAVAVAKAGPELEFRLELVDPLQISGPSIDMAWTGALGLDRRGSGISIQGQLDAQRGRLELLGHRFELARGLVNLPSDGSLDPFVDIIAETSTSEADITVTIRGRASKPELHFSSTPPMGEYQIVTLLVTGSTELGQGDGEVEAKAASLLAAFSSPQLQRQLDRYLGIDRAQLGFGDSVDQPILTVGKRVSPKVWVETSYHHNAPDDANTAEVGVQVDFVRHWSLETYFGDAAIGGVGVYWTHSFGPVPWGPPRRRREPPPPDGSTEAGP